MRFKVFFFVSMLFCGISVVAQPKEAPVEAPVVPKQEVACVSQVDNSDLINKVESLEKEIDHYRDDLSLWLGLFVALITIVVGVVGVIFPLYYTDRADKKLSQRVDKSIEDFGTRSSTAMTELQNQSKSLISDFEKQSSTAVTNLQNKSESLIKDFETKSGIAMTNLQEKSESLLTEIQKQKDELVDSLKSQSEAAIDEIQRNMKEKGEKAIEEVVRNQTRAQAETTISQAATDLVQTFEVKDTESDINDENVNSD